MRVVGRGSPLAQGCEGFRHLGSGKNQVTSSQADAPVLKMILRRWIPRSSQCVAPGGAMFPGATGSLPPHGGF